MSYAWKPDWIWSYESIWGSIEKFKYANVVTNKELHSILNSKRYRTGEIVYTSFYATNNYINKDNLTQILDKDVFKSCERDLEKLLGSLYNTTDLEKYMRDTLYYCPECIKIGYHSIAHQLNFLDNCIFHDIPLSYHCPHCNKESSYMIDFKNNDLAFKCSCGYNYLNESINESDYFSLWRQNDYISQYEKNNIDKYIIRFNHNRYMILSFSWYYNKHFSKTRKLYDRSKEIYRIATDKNIKRNDVYNFKPSFKGCITPLPRESINEMVLIMYINIFKSIARYIRKHTLKGLDIKSYTENRIYYLESTHYKYPKNLLTFKDVNIHLYAYLMWRKDVEGHKSIETIHKFLINNVSRVIDYEIKSNIKSTIFYKYITFEISSYIMEYKNTRKSIFEDYGILLSALERIIGYMLLNHYNNWIKYAKYMKENEDDYVVTFKESIPFTFPDFLFEWEKECEVANLQILSNEEIIKKNKKENQYEL